MDLLFYVNDNIFFIMCMFSRISGVFLSTPVYSARFIPTKVKLILALFFSIILSPSVSLNIENSLYNLFILVFIEFGVGLLIGFISSLFLKSINIFGASVDYMMGFGMMSGLGLDGPSESVSSVLIEYLSLLLFFILNGHIYIFDILSYKLDVFTVFSSLTSIHILPFLIKSFLFIITHGINLALPFLLVFLLIDLCLGSINKSYPSFNVFLFSIPAKAIIFVMLLSYYVFAFIHNFENLYFSNLNLLNDLLKYLNISY